MQATKPSSDSRLNGTRTARVSIASGANIPQIDLEGLLRPAAGTSSVHSATGSPVRSAHTVALADGTRITFATARNVEALEPV